ncbi:MAG TPA: hypothetical protein VF691_00895, partial [Cytophagaceae bacterium]
MYIAVFLITIFFLAFLLLKQSKVQTFVVRKVTENLSNTLKTKVSIGRVDIDFFKTLVLENVYVEDKAKDTILYAGRVKVNIGLLSLSQQKILISYSALENARVNIYKKDGMKEFNYDFILKAFSSNNVDTTGGSTWEFDMEDIELSNIRLSFFDFAGKIDLDVQLKKSQIDLQTLGLNDQHLIVDKVTLIGLQTAFTNLRGTPETLSADTSKQNTQPAPPWSFTVKNLTIENTTLAYNNMNFAEAQSGIDYNHTYVKNLNGEIGLDINSKNYSFNVKSLSLHEESGFILNDLKVSALLTDTSTSINLARFLTPLSDLDHSLKISLPDFAKLQEKVNEIGAQASFDGDVISLQDVAYFAPQVNEFTQIKNQKIIISGDLDGRIDNIVFNDASVSLGKNLVVGDFILKGLPDVDKLTFDVNLERLQTTGKFIAEFVPDKSSPVNITSTGNILASGNFKGNINKFSSNAVIKTSIGQVNHNLRLVLNK